MLDRLLRICKAYDVVVDIWVSIRAETGDPATTAAVDDLTVLRTSRGEWNFCGNSSCLFVRLSLNSRLFVSLHGVYYTCAFRRLPSFNSTD